MRDYRNMTKEEVIELLQEAVADKKKKLLEDVKACLNINNRKDLGFSPRADIIVSLSATARKTEDLDEAIDYVINSIEDVWLPRDDEDIVLFYNVTIDVHGIRDLERFIGYLS